MEFSSIRDQYKIAIIGILVSSLLLLQGCGAGRKGITIDSEPQGANILADGKNIGKTPMHIKQDDVFPPHWYGRNYMVKGNLEIQKEGCEGIKMEVNDLVLSKDIKKSLKCKPGMMQPTDNSVKSETKQAAPVKPAANAKTAVPASTGSSVPAKPSVASDEVEKRLTKLKSLHDRGVITAKEYADQRKRILDSI